MVQEFVDKINHSAGKKKRNEFFQACDRIIQNRTSRDRSSSWVSFLHGDMSMFGRHVKEGRVCPVLLQKMCSHKSIDVVMASYFAESVDREYWGAFGARYERKCVARESDSLGG